MKKILHSFSIAAALASIAIVSVSPPVYAIDQAGCASWLSTAKLDDGTTAIGKDFAWSVNKDSGVLLMDMGAAKVNTGTPQFPVGVRKVDLATAVDKPALLAGMGTFDVASDGTTYMAAAPDMGIGVGGNNVIKVSPTGAVTVLATLDTFGAGFGDVYFAKGYVYVSNLGDGQVYKIDPTVADPASSFTPVYDHGKDGRVAMGLSAIVDADKGNGWSFIGTLGGRRVTALYVDGAILYYGVMWRDNSDIQASWFKDGTAAKTAFDAKSTASNWALSGEVWSVDLDASGNPVASSAKLLYDQSANTDGKDDKPIGDLTINKAGKLLVGTAPFNYSGSMGQHNGGLFALTKGGAGTYTVYEPYANVSGEEGNSGLDAFAERVLVGGEYNIQNGKAYGFANIAQTGTGGSNIDLSTPDATTALYNSFGENFSSLSKGSTGDVEYICSGESAPVNTDLKLEKSANPTSTKRGETVVYTLTVTNESTTDATGVKLVDKLPAGVTHSSDDGAGSYDKTSGVWDVGSLPKGVNKALKITVTVN
ncbi:MAG: DUF11 domain-containing protein [Candidatus Thiothrix sulfatifontis]|nr:MAG: DUF11 domain-containing protein [Candidatus Thiothrix sulfatifontis]